VEAARDRRQAEQIVVCVPLVVVEHDDLILEHLLQVILRVKIEPIFETEAAKVVVHLLLLKEVDLLRLLLVALLV